MKITTRLFSALAIGVALVGLVLAGTLDPPGPPAPTMAALNQIYDRVGGQAGVAKTGQTGCWDVNGAAISCGGTGQDGAFTKGVLASPRFTDNGDGTVTDHLTGLIWLKQRNCFSSVAWPTALADANTLAAGSCGLTDGSAAGAWRLPNVKELQSLIDYGQFTPALPVGHPFSGVGPGGSVWSSSSDAIVPGSAWVINLNYGDVNFVSKSNACFVWPVRGGA